MMCGTHGPRPTTTHPKHIGKDVHYCQQTLVFHAVVAVMRGVAAQEGILRAGGGVQYQCFHFDSTEHLDGLFRHCKST